MNPISFPGLGLAFTMDPVAFRVLGWPVHWYGIIIALGFLLAVGYCSSVCDRYGVTQDDIVDLLLYAAPLGILGARLYYVIFYLDIYRGGGTERWTGGRCSVSGTAVWLFTVES